MELTVTAKPNETPEQHMTRLGEMAQQIMTGRIKAQNQGLDAIHTALCTVTDQINAEQNRLLAVHPELIMLAFASEVR